MARDLELSRQRRAPGTSLVCLKVACSAMRSIEVGVYFIEVGAGGETEEDLGVSESHGCFL